MPSMSVLSQCVVWAKNYVSGTMAGASESLTGVLSQWPELEPAL